MTEKTMLKQVNYSLFLVSDRTGGLVLTGKKNSKCIIQGVDTQTGAGKPIKSGSLCTKSENGTVLIFIEGQERVT